MLKRQHLVFGLSIAGLVLANLTVDVGLLWLMSEISTSGWLNDAVTGVLIGHIILIGIWLGLGDGRWYFRSGLALCLALAVGRTIGVAALLSVNERKNGDLDVWAMVTFLLIPMMLAAALCGLMLRRFRGWRLTWQTATNNAPTRQFQISDVMLWTALLAGALAAIRFVMTYDEHLPDQFLDLSLITTRIVIAVLCGMVVAFASTKRRRTLALMALIIGMATIVLSMPDAYGIVQRASPGFGPRAAFEVLARQEVLVFAAAVLTIANCLVLRVLGCRLVRPVSHGVQPV